MIPLYTLSAALALVASLALNFQYNPQFKESRAVLFAAGIAAVFQLAFDNLTVLAGFWQFNNAAMLGIRIPFMPVENLFFGLSLFLFTILIWERTCENECR